MAMAGPVVAQESRWEAGGGILFVNGDGSPAHDTQTFTAFGRYRFSGKWLAGFSLGLNVFDFERPVELLGFEQDPGEEPVDAKTEATVLSGWLEREHGSAGRVAWFWGPSLGLASVSVDDASGVLADGSAFTVTTDAGLEVIAALRGGLRVRLGERWRLELEARVEEHFADWQLEETVSGTEESVDAYSMQGAGVMLVYRF